MTTRSVSLRLRIAVWYGGLTGAIIALVCLYAYALHSRTSYDAVDGMLQAHAEHIAAELTSSTTTGELEQTLAVAPLLGADARVYDATGAIVRTAPLHGPASPALDPRLLLDKGSDAAYPQIAAFAPTLQGVWPGAGVFRVVTNARGTRWRAYVLPMANRTQFLVTTLPLGSVDSAASNFGRLVLLCAVLAAVTTFFLGWLLARHALRPVAALTAGAMAQSRAMSRRVKNGGERDELGRLATTFNEILGGQQEAYDAQQRFVAAASHELRAPLTVVLANLELLQKDGERSLSESDRTQAVSEAHAEAARMARLVGDLLSLARADAGLPLRREPVELDRVVIEVIGELRRQVEGQRLSVTAFEAVTVQGDPDRLKQLVLILIDNAIKYTAAGARIDVSLRLAASEATIEVRDTGVGIAPADLRRVFERFYRADPSRARNAGGTGLGLPIARWIAEEHGGTVELASTLGQGTTATVRLPAWLRE